MRDLAPSILMIVLMIVPITTSAQRCTKCGFWLGSIGLIDKTDGFVPLDTAKIALIHKDKLVTVRSNENGDFMFLQLLPGQYCVDSISDKNGQPFSVKGSQNKCFDIRKKKKTRFDIVVQQK